MGKFVKITGPIEASTIYSGSGQNKTLVACDANVTLPEVAPVTADVNGIMGTGSIPLAGVIEDMEMTITKVGVDRNLALLTKPGMHEVEVRWVQDEIDANGNTSKVGCKAFMNVLAKTLMPGASLEVGASSENDTTFEVTRYRLLINNEEVFLIDRFSKILKVLGVDYADMDSML